MAAAAWFIPNWSPVFGMIPVGWLRSDAIDVCEDKGACLKRQFSSAFADIDSNLMFVQFACMASRAIQLSLLEMYRKQTLRTSENNK